MPPSVSPTRSPPLPRSIARAPPRPRRHPFARIPDTTAPRSRPPRTSRTPWRGGIHRSSPSPPPSREPPRARACRVPSPTRACAARLPRRMVPVRIDPTRPDPPHRLNRTDRSIDRPDRCSVSTHAPSARPRHRSNGTDAPILIDRSHRYRSIAPISIAPISIGTHRYGSIATATA